MIEVLFQRKETLGKERDGMTTTVESLARMAGLTQQKVADMEEEKLASEEKLSEIKAKLHDKGQETDRELARKESLDARLKDLRVTLDETKEDYKLKQARVQAEVETVKRVDELTKAAEAQEKELESDFKRLAEEKRLCELKLDQEMGKNTKLLQENTERELLLRAKREEVAQLKNEKDKLVKLQESLKKKIESVEEQRRGAEVDRSDIKAELKNLSLETEQKQREVDADRKKIEDLLRERDILNKNVIKTDEKTKKQIDLVKRQETQQHNLLKDILNKNVIKTDEKTKK